MQMIKQKEKYRQFKKWQHQPHEVAPLSEEMHECATCGTHFEGNYCPRCGQSCKIARYSFKNALLLYLDVWGLGTGRSNHKYFMKNRSLAGCWRGFFLLHVGVLFSTRRKKFSYTYQ